MSNRLELGVGVDREPRLDDVGAHRVELRGYLAFVVVGERDTRSLFAVAQRRVENPYLFDLGVTDC